MHFYWCQMASKCQIHVRSRQRTYFSFFMPPNSFYKPLNFLLYETNTFFRVCVLYAEVYRCIQITEDVTACKEQQSRHSTLFRVVLFCSLRCDIICNLLQYTQGKNVIFLLNNKCRNPNGCVCRYLPINRVHVATSDMIGTELPFLPGIITLWH